MPTAAEYLAKKKQGICVDCRQPALPTLTRCAFHHEQNLKAHRRYYQRHHDKMIKKREVEYKRSKEEGRCHCCFKLLVDGMGDSRCPDCMEKHRLEG